MSILMQMFTVFVINVYFYIVGEEVITKHLGEIIRLKTKFNGVEYECVCQEITFKVVNKGIFGYTKINRVYRVSMKDVNDTDYTYNTYPMLCSEVFRYTKYPYMLAIKTHYMLYYD